MPSKTRSEYVATPAAGLRVISRVDQTIQAVDEEFVVLAFPFILHLSDWHHTNTVFLQTQQSVV